MGRRSHRSDRRHIPEERISILFDQASRFFNEDPAWSNRCVEHARSIAMKERLSLPAAFRRLFCRRCYSYFVPGETMRIRIHRGRIVVTCLKCGYHRRYPIPERIHEEN